VWFPFFCVYCLNSVFDAVHSVKIPIVDSAALRENIGKFIVTKHLNRTTCLSSFA